MDYHDGTEEYEEKYERAYEAKIRADLLQDLTSRRAARSKKMLCKSCGKMMLIKKIWMRYDRVKGEHRKEITTECKCGETSFFVEVA